MHFKAVGGAYHVVYITIIQMAFMLIDVEMLRINFYQIENLFVGPQ